MARESFVQAQGTIEVSLLTTPMTRPKFTTSQLSATVRAWIHRPRAVGARTPQSRRCRVAPGSPTWHPLSLLSMQDEFIHTMAGIENRQDLPLQILRGGTCRGRQLFPTGTSQHFCRSPSSSSSSGSTSSCSCSGVRLVAKLVNQ